MVTEEHDRTSQWQLLRRPYQLGDGGEWSWEACERRWRTFNDPEKWPRSLAKRLLETLARRPGETETLVRELASRGRLLPEAAPGTGTWFDGGAVIGGNNTLYFDPLDILDFHVDWSAATNPDHKEDADVAIAD
jgi:hypothetical protein